MTATRYSKTRVTKELIKKIVLGQDLENDLLFEIKLLDHKIPFTSPVVTALLLFIA